MFSCGSKKAQKQPTARKKVSPELVYKKAFHEAMRLKLTGKYADAEKALEQCLALNPNDDGVNFALSELSSYKKDIESAIQFGEKASEKHRYVGGYLTEDSKYLMISASTSTSGNKLFIKDLSKENSKLSTVFKEETFPVKFAHSKVLVCTGETADPNS